MVLAAIIGNYGWEAAHRTPGALAEEGPCLCIYFISFLGLLSIRQVQGAQFHLPEQQE